MSDDAEDERVGYGHPPKHSRFVKGQSGNPSGRPKGARSLKTIIEAELNEKVTIVVNGRSRRLTKRELAVKALVSKALKGDIRSFIEVARFSEAAGGEAPAEAPLSPEEEALLGEYYSRQRGRGS
jgi:hypothetical protein